DMLQHDHLQSTVGFPAPEHGDLGQIIDLALGFLLRQYLVILFLALLGGVGVAGAIFLFVTPQYVAQAKILIGTQKAQFVQQQSIFADAPIDNAQMESQIQILQSQAILAAVVQKLKLADEPEFANPPVPLMRRVFQIFTNPISAAPEVDETEVDA